MPKLRLKSLSCREREKGGGEREREREREREGGREGGKESHWVTFS